MAIYKIKIFAARPIEVEAENEKEAFELAFDDTEWDFNIEEVSDAEKG